MVPLLCLLPLVPLARAQCALLSVAECQPDPAEVIREISLPSDQGAGYSQVCQQLCGVEEACNHWSYDGASSTCSLLSYCYLHSCDSLTAGAEPDTSDCLCRDSGSCADLVRENCALLGSVVWRGEAVTDTHPCQVELQTIHRRRRPLLGPHLRH